jgi:general stress protein YciG
MDEAKQREIASKGGRAAHLKGTAHEFTTDEARAAGRKGGETVSRDRHHMAEIGRKGGISSRAGVGGNTPESDSASDKRGAGKTEGTRRRTNKS